MKNLLKSIVAIAALSLAASSCQKDNNFQPVNASRISGQAALETTCCECVSDSVVVTGTHTGTFFLPTSWNTIYFSLCSGVTTSGNADFKLDNRFTSYLTGQNGIIAGVLDSNYYNPASFNSISCFDTARWDTGTAALGAIGVPAGSNGWYVYNNNDPFTVLPTKLIVLKKVCNNTTYYYLVRLRVDVEELVPGTTYESKVTIEYKCISASCAI